MAIEMIGKQIAAMRKEKGVKQEELANYVGVSTQAVSKWENGGVPDTDLLPKIADFFGVSIDTLFGRSLTDCNDLPLALINKIREVAPAERFKTALTYCWYIEQALMHSSYPLELVKIEDLEKEIEENEQIYSAIKTDEGFTGMGVAHKLQYFFIMPNQKDTNAAFFNGIDYPAFFHDFSDKDVFEACIMLNKRDHNKAFTPTLLVKHLNISEERAKDVLNVLRKYRFISCSEVELDDELQTVYHFRPDSSFIALLIFAKEVIDKPQNYWFHTSARKKPYFL